MYNDAMMGGPSIEGKWYNKRTGNTIIVRDMVMDDYGMQVLTADGNMIDGDEFSRDYIQCDDTEYDINGNPTGESSAIDYDLMFDNNVNTNINNISTIQSSPVNSPESSNIVNTDNSKFGMLDMMFQKLKQKPKVTCNIVWKGIPKAEINMLKNYFDVNNTDIADYIFSKYCPIPEFKDQVSKAISKMLNEKEK